MNDSSTAQPSANEIAEERRRLRWLRILAELTISTLYQQRDLSLSEAMELVSQTRKAMLGMFPGKELAYDLLYRPRFDRVIADRFHQPH